MASSITVESFGYLHAAAPAAGRVEDVRDRLRDPARVRGLLDLDGRDDRVRHAVLTTPGALPLVFDLAEYLTSLRVDRAHTVAIGCAGGRHRSVVLAETLGHLLNAIGYAVTVTHRDIHRPRVIHGGDH